MGSNKETPRPQNPFRKKEGESSDQATKPNIPIAGLEERQSAPTGKPAVWKNPFTKTNEGPTEVNRTPEEIAEQLANEAIARDKLKRIGDEGKPDTTTTAKSQIFRKRTTQKNHNK